MCRTRFGLPVHEVCSEKLFASPPYTSRLVVPPPVDSSFLGEGAKVFDVLAANTFQNEPISGAAKKRTPRPRANTHPDQPDPGPRKRIAFHCFRNTTYTPNWQAINFQSMRRCKLRKWPLGLKWTIFPPMDVVYDVGTRVGSFKI